ncbi:MAG: hypothetical protein KME26_19655 [Oscillatoria princeps RMCB-10]|nr:hypothetical protein [Oscillatoria princeps RMCB-10]
MSIMILPQMPVLSNSTGSPQRRRIYIYISVRLALTAPGMNPSLVSPPPPYWVGVGRRFTVHLLPAASPRCPS